MHSGISNLYFAYDLDNQAIQQVNKEKDTGIVLDNQLKLHPHTALVARNPIGFLHWLIYVLIL